jgi:hypothetical protein
MDILQTLVVLSGFLSVKVDVKLFPRKIRYSTHRTTFDIISKWFFGVHFLIDDFLVSTVLYSTVYKLSE